MVQCIFHLPDCPRRDFYTIESQSEGTLFSLIIVPLVMLSATVVVSLIFIQRKIT